MNADRIPVHVVVFTLGSVVIIGVTAMVLLAFSHNPVPDPLDRIVTLALGALAGILAQTHPASSQDVNVVNTDTSPVPVDPTATTPAHH